MIAVADVVVLASRNAAKLRELARILDAAGSGARLAGLDEFPGAPEVPETGATFEENALLKARAIADYTGLPAVADDSGLCLDALNGMPGVRAGRWAGRHGGDQANLELVLAQVADVPDTRLGAQFVCAAALVAGGAEWVVTGRVEGRLIRAPRGSGDFVKIQGTAEREPFSRDLLGQLLDLAVAGCGELTRLQHDALA